MGRIASTILMSPPELHTKVGKEILVGWTADLMHQRIPAWLVVSVDAPARFEGEGYFALNAGGLGPFGVGVDADRQRAFVPLFEGDMARKGVVKIEPLEAQTYTIRATLVTYLRACQQEMSLASAEWAVEVAPGSPEIVLREFTSRNPFDRVIEVPEFGRSVVLNNTRFQILNTSDMSEVISREGKELRLSPTKRFLVSHDAGQFEVIDIVDGETVGEVDGRQLAFWNADSFFLSEMGFSGLVSLGATLRPKIYFKDFGTGSACCSNGGNTHISVSLENNMVRVEDSVHRKNESAYSLLNGDNLGFTRQRVSREITSSSLGESIDPMALKAVGTVAPLDVQSKWDLPLGPFFIYGFSNGKIRAAGSQEDVAINGMAIQTSPAVPNPSFGRQERLVSLNNSAATVLRGLDPDSPAHVEERFVMALARWGVSMAPHLEPVQWLDRSGAYDRSKGQQSAQFQRVISQIEMDLAVRGQRANWSLYDSSEYLTSYCEHIPVFPPDGAVPKAAYDLQLAYRFPLPGRTIWVTRSRCDGGATASSILHNTTMSIYDSSAPGSTFGSYAVETGGSFGGSRASSLIDKGFKVKLFAQRLMVTYAPGEGAVTVYDLATRKFLMQLEYARRGALMDDVFVDNELRHLFQMNTDGSFTVYRLSDQAAIIEGRYLDDELVAWLPDFRYDATEEGAAFVELRFPGQPGQYSFQQFGGALQVPKLMQRVLSQSALDPTTGVLGVPPNLETRLSVSGDQILGLALTNSKNTLQTVRLFQDGLLTDSFAPAGNTLINLKATRRKGTRWVTLIAEDERGLVSLPSSVDLGPDPMGLVNTHFFGVGVDFYSDPQLVGLNYAKVDALRLSEGLSELNGRTLNLINNEILVDRRADKEAILAHLKTIVSNATEGDNLVMFFAGHGLQDSDGNFYMGLSSTRLDDLAGTALAWSKIADVLNGSKLRVTVFLDACHAGAAQTNAFSTNDSAVERLTQNSDGGLTILSAAKGRQFSGESASVGGGYFTSAVLEVLSIKRNIYDENKNGILEIIELYRGVKEEVMAHRQAEQTPWLSRNLLVGEHGLF